MISKIPAEPLPASRAGRQPARRRRAAVLNLCALVIAVLTAPGVLACAAPSATPDSPAVGPRALPPAPRSEPQDAVIIVSAPQRPYAVPGSDGLQHVEYDLVVANTAATPAALTVVEVLTADGQLLLRLDGPALVAATQPLDGTSPTAEIPGSTAVAVVVDLGLAPDQPHRASHAPDRLPTPRCARRFRFRPAGLGPRPDPRPAATGHDHCAVERSRMAHREQLLRRLHHAPRRSHTDSRRSFRQDGDLRRGLDPAPRRPAVHRRGVQPASSGSVTEPALSRQRAARSSPYATASRSNHPTRCLPASIRPGRPAIR